MMAASTTKVTAACACGGFKFDITFPNSILPIDRAICLCNSCRSLTGSCGATYIIIPEDNVFDSKQYDLTSYNTSDPLTRYFCSTCGAHVACVRPGTTFLATGLWDKTEGIIKWVGNKYVEDTLDGGVSVWFEEIEDQDGTKRDMKRWLKRWIHQDGDNPQVPAGTLQTYQRPHIEGEARDKLKASCHCGGVKFHVTRPDESSKKAYSWFPDCIIPFHTGKSFANPDNEPWCLRDNETKYFAGLCTCKSCRAALGFEIQTWAFIPKSNIVQENGTPMSFDMGTLKRYVSSEGTFREFCGVCGATVFWHCDKRPELLDVSVGLLDPAEGARVEGWLEWGTSRVSFAECAVSTSLVKSLESGLKNWNR